MKNFRKIHLDNLVLGRFSLAAALGSLTALLSTLIVPPIAEALMVSSMAGLFTVMAALVTAFLALLVAALVTGWASRRTQAARLGLLLVPITLVVALAVTAFLKHQADTLGGATVLPALPAASAAAR